MLQHHFYTAGFAVYITLGPALGPAAICPRKIQMRLPPLWNEDDLLELIQLRATESLLLEYKSSDALAQSDGKKNELSKDVSAFANSAGGTIVYGMLEDGHIPTALDSGYDKEVISKEWLEQVINSRIHRRIDGVVINQVHLAKSAPGRVAYVISIPQSVRAPHQAADKRFYKRFNFESVPMEEYEVRDTSRRSEAPDLAIKFNLTFATPPTAIPAIAPAACTVFLAPSVSNAAPAPANYAVFNFYLDSRLELSNGAPELTGVGEASLTCGGNQYNCRRYHLNHSIPGKLPIFQGVTFGLLGTPINLLVSAPGRYLVAYDVIAPGMDLRLEASYLEWDGAEALLVSA